jgi:hypothetical protein
VSRVVVSGDRGLILVDQPGISLQTFPPSQITNPKETFWYPFLVAEGQELLLFDGKTSTLHGYAMP